MSACAVPICVNTLEAGSYLASPTSFPLLNYDKRLRQNRMTGDQSVYLLFLVTLGKIIIVSTEKKTFVLLSGLITKLDAERAVPVKVDATGSNPVEDLAGLRSAASMKIMIFLH